MDKTEILARFDFYRRATPAQRTEFAAATESVRLPAGHAFYREGGAMAHVAFVGTGNIRVSKLAESGRELHLYHVRGGEACIVNMVCAYLHRPAVADARVEADTEAAVVAADTFRRFVRDTEPMREFVFAAFAGRMVDVMTLADEIAFGRVGARLEALLVRQFARRRTIDATHEWLAGEVGTAREVVSRLLKVLERRGAIALGRGRIELRDRGRLGDARHDGDAPLPHPRD